MKKSWRRHLSRGETSHVLSPEEIARALKKLGETGEVSGLDVGPVSRILGREISQDDSQNISDKKPGVER